MSFKMCLRWMQDISSHTYSEVSGEVSRLEGAGWSFRWLGNNNFPEIEREIKQLHLLKVHWNERFLDLEPEEIEVTFENALLPTISAKRFDDRGFLHTPCKWKRFESVIFPGFWYEIHANSEQKILKVHVSGRTSGDDWQSKENRDRFFHTLCLIFASTRIARHLHQFRMVAVAQSELSNWKRNVQEMDRHYNEILKTLGAHLPR